MRQDHTPRCLLSIRLYWHGAANLEATEISELYDHAASGDLPQDEIVGPVLVEACGPDGSVVYERSVQDQLDDQARQRERQASNVARLREQRPPTFLEYARDAMNPDYQNRRCVYCVVDPGSTELYGNELFFCRSCLVGVVGLTAQ